MPWRFACPLALVLSLTTIFQAAAPQSKGGGQDAEQSQQKGQPDQRQSQEQGQTQSQEKPKTGSFLSALKAISTSSCQESSPTAASGESSRIDKPDPKDFPLSVQVTQTVTATPAMLLNLQRTQNECEKGSQAAYSSALCKQMVTVQRQMYEGVEVKIGEKVYRLQGRPLQVGIYSARSARNGHGFELLTPDEKCNQTEMYSIKFARPVLPDK
jgi:hypothetical protein